MLGGGWQAWASNVQSVLTACESGSLVETKRTSLFSGLPAVRNVPYLCMQAHIGFRTYC